MVEIVREKCIVLPFSCRPRFRPEGVRPITIPEVGKLAADRFMGSVEASPFSLGDVVVLCDGSLAVVYAAWESQRHLHCLALDELGNLAMRCDLPEIVLAERSDVRRVVASREDLVSQIHAALERMAL